MPTLCTNFKRNRSTFISKSAPVSQAEALKRYITANTPQCFIGYPNNSNLVKTHSAARRIFDYLLGVRISQWNTGCVPLGWSRSGSVIQDMSGSWCIKGTGESTLVTDSLVPLIHHDPDRSWITDPDPDHPKGTQPLSLVLFENDDIVIITWFPWPNFPQKQIQNGRWLFCFYIPRTVDGKHLRLYQNETFVFKFRRRRNKFRR